MTVEKFPLDDRDKFMIKVWKGGVGLPADIAATVDKYGTISLKQRQCLHKATMRLVRNGPPLGDREEFEKFGFKIQRPSYTVDRDYDDSDYEIGAYELCVGEWGD